MAEIYLMLARRIRIGFPSLSIRRWEKPASRLEDTIDCVRRRSGLGLIAVSANSTQMMVSKRSSRRRYDSKGDKGLCIRPQVPMMARTQEAPALPQALRLHFLVETLELHPKVNSTTLLQGNLQVIKSLYRFTPYSWPSTLQNES